MLITITLNKNKQPLETPKTIDYQASDLSDLLHKNPDNLHEFSVSFGKAHVFFSEHNDDVCSATLFMDLDSIDIVKSYQSPAGESRLLKQYVNDRPYAVNSFFTVALSRAYRTALSGKCPRKPELAKQALPFTVHLPVLPSRGGEALIRELFEPLGYQLTIQPYLYDSALPDWGNSSYFDVTFTATLTIQQLLQHFYVLIPVLDNEKHYWVTVDEVDKLLIHGSEWIPTHPKKPLIARRYLKKQGSLTRKALDKLQVNESQLTEEELKADQEATQEKADINSQAKEDKLEKKIRLNDLRIQKVTETIRTYGVNNVIDMGCGEGKYLREYLKIPSLQKVVGVEVSSQVLKRAEERLKIDRLPERLRDKVKLLQGSLTYNDKRTQGYDMVTCIEVIEHIDEDRLDAFAQSLFGFAKPTYVVLTTPNVEFNATFENLPAGKFRHSDHRFEWDRKTFENWCDDVCQQYGYQVSFDGIGEVHPEYGSPTQMGLFTMQN